MQITSSGLFLCGTGGNRRGYKNYDDGKEEEFASRRKHIEPPAMDGSILVFSIGYLQRSMAGNNIRQIAYDECQFDLRLYNCMICQFSL